MISVHYYDPWDFAGEENGNITQWGPGATNPSKTSTWGQEDYMDSQLKKMLRHVRLEGLSGGRRRVRFDRQDLVRLVEQQVPRGLRPPMVATAKKYGAATIYWDNGVNGQYGFGLFNRASNTVTQQGIIDAIRTAPPASRSPSRGSSPPHRPRAHLTIARPTPMYLSQIISANWCLVGGPGTPGRISVS